MGRGPGKGEGPVVGRGGGGGAGVDVREEGGGSKKTKGKKGRGGDREGGGDGFPLESMWSQLRRSREAAAAASRHQSAVPSPTSSFSRLLLH